MAMCSARTLHAVSWSIIFLAFIWIWDISASIVETRRDDGSATTFIHLSVLEGAQTSLPCPIDTSKKATSAVWFHITSDGSSRHSNRPRHLQVMKVYALEVPDLPPSTISLEGTSALVDGTHWKQSSWSGRAFFSLLSDPPALLLNRVKREDSGSYICNVTYRDNVTSYAAVTATVSRVELFVAAQPCPPVIKNAKGAPLEAMAGPFAEGDTLRLTCEVEACDHDLRLIWYHNGVQQRTAHETMATSQGGWKSLVTLGPLRRADLYSNLTCAAISNVSLPGAVTALVDMFLAPTAVTIWSWPGQKMDSTTLVPLTDDSQQRWTSTRATPIVSDFVSSVGKEMNGAKVLASFETSPSSMSSRSFECETSGSRPAANITWFLDGRAVNSAHSHSETKSDVSTSMLLLPRSLQSGKLLECRATNGNLPENLGVMSCYLKMATSHKTEVSVRLGLGLNASYITEGADVYMECSILAASRITDVSWRREGRALQKLSGHSSEAVVTSHYLVIRGVNVNHSGRYTCWATTADGETKESAPLELRVRHSPRCNAPRDKVLEATPGEAMNVTCDVTADPSEGLSYYWVAEDNAGNRRRVYLGATEAENEESNEGWPSEQDSNRMELLVATYLFHATLLCWARNSVGPQREPCRYRFQLRRNHSCSINCTAGNYTDTSFSLTCTSRNQVPAGGGGHPEGTLARLHIQLYEATARNRSIRDFWAWESSDVFGKPVFLTGLKPGSEYLLVARLELEMATFATYVRTLAQAQTLRERKEKGSLDSTQLPLVSTEGILICAASVATLGLTIVGWALWYKCHRRKSQHRSVAAARKHEEHKTYVASDSAWS